MDNSTITTKVNRIDFYPIIICTLASLFYVYDYFIQVAPSIMTNDLMRDFSIGAGELGVLSASFYYSYTLMQIPAGILLDNLGARKLLSFAVLISAIGVLLFGLAEHFITAGVGRFLIGFGSSFAFISALFLASRWFSHKYFAMIAGLVQLGGCVGSIFGLAPLAVAVNHYGWRETMITAAIITFIFAAMFWLIIRDGQPPKSTIKTKKQGIKKEIHHLKILLSHRQVWWIALCGLVSWVPVAVLGALWGVPYLMRVYHISNVYAGNLISLFWIALAIGSTFVGWYSGYRGIRKSPVVICFIMGLIGAIMLLLATYLPLWITVITLILLGLSSSVQSLSFGIIKDVVPPELFGSAAGINNMAVILGGALTQPLVGYLLHLNWDGTLKNNTPFYTVNDYSIAFLVIILAMLIGVLVAVFKLKETNCQPQY